MQNQKQVRDARVFKLLEAAQAMQAVLTGDCQHPSSSILSQYPRTTGGRQECLVCRQVRTQKWHGGPWGAWRCRDTK